MGLARVVLPLPCSWQRFRCTPASGSRHMSKQHRTLRGLGAGVIAVRKTPTARLMEERWLPMDASKDGSRSASARGTPQ